MRVTITVRREYEMDERRVLAEAGFEPPGPEAAPAELRAWLRESFYELCGFDRDEDHVDGTYVHLTNDGVRESTEAIFDWPEVLYDH